VDDKPGRTERIGLKGRPMTVCFALPVCVTQEKTTRISLMVIASALKRDVFDPYKQTDVSVEVLHLALVDL
jgi:hypothetical protein